MSQLTRIEVNCTTGEQKVIPLTAQEIAELDQLRAEAEARRVAEETEAQAKLAEKEAIAAKLGLTPEELLKLLS